MKRLLPFVVLLIVLIGGVVSVTVLLNPERHRAEITQLVSKPFKRPAVIGPMSMSYFPPTLRLSQVAAMKEGGIPALEVDLITAPLDVASLLKMKLIPSSLVLSHWKLTLTRKPEGHWDVADWFAGLAGTASSVHGGVFTGVRWKDGEIHAVDPSIGPSQGLVLGSVEGAWVPKENSLTFSGACTGIGSPDQVSFTSKGFLTSPEWSGDLQLLNGGESCAVRIDHKAASWAMVGKSTKWSLANALALARFYGRAAKSAGSSSPISLDGWQFTVTKNGARLSFEHAAGISGGLSNAKGTLDIVPAGSALRTDLVAKDVPAEAFWALAGETIPLSGKVTFGAKDFQVSLSTGIVRLASGEGYWELKDGVYNVPAVSLNKLAKAKTMPYIQKKFPDLMSKGLPMNKLSAHWRVKEGLVVTEDGAFASMTLKGGWTGKFDVARAGMDGYVRLELREKDPKLVSLIPHRYRTQPLFGRIQGTWQEWTLRSIQMTRIPSAVHAKLRKAMSQK